jgi:hypothetical protein
MNKIGLVLRELHSAENDLAVELLRAADRHKTDHEVYHVARDLAGWSHTHVHRIAEMGQRYGVNLSGQEKNESGVMSRLRETASEMVGRRPEPGLLLLADLRKLHRMATGISLDYELIGQAAQAIKDVDLLELTKICHPQTLRQMRWTNKLIKELSPQVLSSGSVPAV